MQKLLLACGVCVSLFACSSAPAESASTGSSGGETVAADDGSSASPPPTAEPSQPAEGSPECAGCTYSSSPGYPDASGRGGVNEWCMGTDAAGGLRTCAMSCCRTARGG